MNAEAITGLEEHPYLPSVSAGFTEEERVAYVELRRQALVNEVVDPFRCGFELEIWGIADEWRKRKREEFPKGVITEVNLGGNRSSKSKRAAKRVVEACMLKAGSVWWCCDSTETQSRANQQRYIEQFLPYEWKPDESGQLGRKRLRTTKVRYSLAGGFTDNNLVLPNGSEIYFKFYEMNVENLPGPELDGVWADELIPLEWIEVLRYRLTNRNGILHITFTPETGWSPTVGKYLDGARTLEWKEAELCPVKDNTGEIVGHEKLPKVQQPTEETAIVIYFWSEDNPFWGNYEGMKVDVRGKPKHQLMMRAYGYVTKAAHAKFPSFSQEVHVVSMERFREIQSGGGIWYHFLDPCSGRNWFQFWVFIDVINRAFVVGESPSFGHALAYIPGIGDPGPWATSGSKADGDVGEGQREWGWGYARYLEEIERMERLLSGHGVQREAETGGFSEGIVHPLHETPAQKITISARWMDARYGNARKTTEERSVTMIEELSNLGMDFLAAPSEKYIDSGHGGGDGSLRMISDRLFYDQEKSVDLTNSPRLFVVETCPNTIYSLRSWTGKDGQHGACKDPIDCLRMFVLSGVEFVDERLLQPQTPWLRQFKR